MLSDQDINMIRDMLQTKMDEVEKDLKGLTLKEPTENNKILLHFLIGKFEGLSVAKNMFVDE